MSAKTNMQTRLGNLRKKITVIENSISRRCIVWISAVFALSFLVKFFIVYTSKALLADYGTYLRFADVIRGIDILGKGLRYPPNYPILLNLFLIPFDQIIALQLCASFTYSIIAIPFFFLASKICKSKMLALIASLLIVFNIFYSEMMGWGGNANMLSFSFITAFIVFWLNSLRNNNWKRDGVFAAFFLSLSVGSHYLAAAYLAIFLLVTLFLMVIFRKHFPEKNLIKKTLFVSVIGLAFSCPYISGYKYLLDSPLLRETGTALADQRSIENAIYFLYKNVINIVLISLGVIGICILIKKKDKLKGMIIGALLLSACIPLITQHPARWLYFWPIPIFLGITALVETLITSRPSSPKNVSSKKVVIVIGIIILIFVYILNSVIYLQEASRYYTNLTSDGLDALKWIKNNTKFNSIIATSGPYRRGSEGTGQSYGWWVEGYAQRICISTCYLRFLMYYDERNLADKANLIFSGTDVLKNDFIMAAETYGDKQGILEMGINIGDFYEKILFFNDTEVIIAYEQDSHFGNMTLTDIGNKTKNVPPSVNVPTIKIVYFSELLNATKETMVSDDSSAIDVSFRFDYHIQPTLNITSIAIPIFKSDFVDVTELNMNSDNSTTLNILSPMKASVSTKIQVEYNGIMEIEPNYVPWYEKAQKIITYNISQLQEVNVVHFRVIFPKLVNSSHSRTEYYNAYELIDSLKISYIMINNNRKREYEWLASDTKNFTIVYKNKEITIFSVHLQ